MSSMFVKIYGDRLLNSTLWLEEWQPRLVFLGMLASADEDGFVDMPCAEVLALRLNLPLSDVEKGLAVLESSDLKSRSKEAEGRRIIKTDSGWQLVNYVKYREFRTRAQVNGAKRASKHYAKNKANVKSVRTNGSTPDLDSDLDSDLEREERESARVAPPPQAAPRRPIGSAHVQEWSDALRELAESRGRAAPSPTHAQTQQIAQRCADLARVHGTTYREAALALAGAALDSPKAFAFVALEIDPYAAPRVPLRETGDEHNSRVNHVGESYEAYLARRKADPFFKAGSQ